jgi:hypothetical protein
LSGSGRDDSDEEEDVSRGGGFTPLAGKRIGKMRKPELEFELRRSITEERELQEKLHTAEGEMDVAREELRAMKDAMGDMREQLEQAGLRNVPDVDVPPEGAPKKRDETPPKKGGGKNKGKKAPREAKKSVEREASEVGPPWKKLKAVSSPEEASDSDVEDGERREPRSPFTSRRAVKDPYGALLKFANPHTLHGPSLSKGAKAATAPHTTPIRLFGDNSKGQEVSKGSEEQDQLLTLLASLKKKDSNNNLQQIQLKWLQNLHAFDPKEEDITIWLNAVYRQMPEGGNVKDIIKTISLRLRGKWQDVFDETFEESLLDEMAGRPLT